MFKMVMGKTSQLVQFFHPDRRLSWHRHTSRSKSTADEAPGHFLLGPSFNFGYGAKGGSAWANVTNAHNIVRHFSGQDEAKTLNVSNKDWGPTYVIASITAKHFTTIVQSNQVIFSPLFYLCFQI